jgi:phospholipid-translocating ATPase
MANLQINKMTVRERINKKNMILRGCKLKNTDWVVGMVIYTGDETAIMMNSSEPFTKASNIETMVNRIILVIFAFELLCSLGTAIFGLFECRSKYEFVKTITQNADTNCARLMGISFGSYFILYSTFIPISLIVSL